MVIVLQSSTSISLLRVKMRGTTPDSLLSPGESILDYNLELLGRQPKVRLVFLFFLVSSCITYFCFIDVCISCIKKNYKKKESLNHHILSLILVDYFILEH